MLPQNCPQQPDHTARIATDGGVTPGRSAHADGIPMERPDE
jgi:hypothetical protein